MMSGFPHEHPRLLENNSCNNERARLEFRRTPSLTLFPTRRKRRTIMLAGDAASTTYRTPPGGTCAHASDMVFATRGAMRTRTLLRNNFSRRVLVVIGATHAFGHRGHNAFTPPWSIFSLRPLFPPMMRQAARLLPNGASLPTPDVIAEREALRYSTALGEISR